MPACRSAGLTALPSIWDGELVCHPTNASACAHTPQILLPQPPCVNVTPVNLNVTPVNLTPVGGPILQCSSPVALDTLQYCNASSGSQGGQYKEGWL